MTEEKNASIKPELNLAEKIAMATGDMGAIQKDGTNGSQKWKFISESAIKGAIREVLPRYGISIIPKEIQIIKSYERSTKYGGSYYFYDILQTFDVTDGREHWQGQAMGTGSDSGDKALNKAMTIAFKNFEKQLFNVSDQSDKDPDSETIPQTVDQRTEQNTKRKTTAQPNYKQYSDDELKNYKVFYTPEKREEFIAVIYNNATKGDEIAGNWWKENRVRLNTPEGQHLIQYEKLTERLKAESKIKQEADAKSVSA